MKTTLLQTGIYTISEAARLTGVSSRRIRRWLRGYEFRVKHGRHRSAPVWHGQLDPMDHSMALGFLDLIEIRCVDAFVQAGVGWKTLRLAHQKAQDTLSITHPFCTNQFKVSGREIILELKRDDTEPQLWEIARNQRVFDKITRPFMKDLVFAQGAVPSQWWPMGTNRLVVLDPRRSFGQPIVSDSGVPTIILDRAVKAASLREVAGWYEVHRAEIQDAVEFEHKLAA
jgi:uncharacterized protein (DUF433 family)